MMFGMQHDRKSYGFFCKQIEEENYFIIYLLLLSYIIVIIQTFRIVTIFVMYVNQFFSFQFYQQTTSLQKLAIHHNLWIHSLYASRSSGSIFVNDKIIFLFYLFAKKAIRFSIMLHPKHHLYLHVISAQNTVGYLRVIF